MVKGGIEALEDSCGASHNVGSADSTNTTRLLTALSWRSPALQMCVALLALECRLASRHRLHMLAVQTPHLRGSCVGILCGLGGVVGTGARCEIAQLDRGVPLSGALKPYPTRARRQLQRPIVDRVGDVEIAGRADGLKVARGAKSNETVLPGAAMVAFCFHRWL